jgi:cytochrome b subunit of formate dehydrogenase
MLLHNVLDFYKKLKVHHATVTSGKRSRMGVNERIQHGFLAFSFILLAYTGFTLVYPTSWWALPFMGRLDWRGLGHRLGALIFCVLSVYHLYYITCTKSGRKHLKLLLPRKIDLIQCGQSFKYYFGKREQKPIFGFYGYIEKLEYWALVWGSFIMIVTGVLMTRETWFLSNLPKWLFDVVTAVHYYEAILACLAILLWHGYFVMFDPDEYPMKWTWYSGHESSVDEERKTDHTE